MICLSVLLIVGGMVIKMRFFGTLPNWVLCVVILWGSFSISAATEPISDVSGREFDLSNPSQRQAFRDALRERRRPGIERAAEYIRQTGKPKRWFDGTNTCELMSIEEDGQFIVYTTCNANSAISIAADIVRDDPYYALTGNGIPVGVWDAGSARATHQELTGRTTWKDAASPGENYHSTAVAGTVGATGVVPAAKGMAPLTQLWGYEWNYDDDEMTAVAMSSLVQTDKIQISNHSYGPVCGWYNNGQWIWVGTPPAQESYCFGSYSSNAASFDDICYKAPYYLPIRAAGNDRGDGGRPADGTTYYINGSTAATFYAATGPYADNGTENGGFDTLMSDACAKNVLTVGGVDDAVTNGLRDLSKAAMSSLSAWGPTDDGRIKPDVVANCTGVYSCDIGGDASYQNLTGTSMAAPAAAGAAAQLVELYGRLFPGQAMRSSTIKALLIHTADDLGNPGPDYKFGWGLINAQAAVDKILLHKHNPTLLNIKEDSLKRFNPNKDTEDDFTFVWDGVSPIKATLCYTDPAGTAISSLDDRNPQLVNDLDITITAPDGITKYNEFVLDWLNPNNLAIMGNNDRDNVKQVLIVSPTQSGTYTIRVDFDKLDNTQNYSLIISGQHQPAVYDIDGDFTIGLGDLAAMANAWLTSTAASDIYPAIGDGVVDMLDFAMLSQIWLAP